MVPNIPSTIFGLHPGAAMHVAPATLDPAMRMVAFNHAVTLCQGYKLSEILKAANTIAIWLETGYLPGAPAISQEKENAAQ